MRLSYILFIGAVILASGCIGQGNSEAVPVNEGLNYEYSVNGPDVEDGGYSLSLVEKDGEVYEFDISSEINGESVRGSFSHNQGSSDYLVNADPEVGYIFNYYSAFARPFPFVFRDLDPEDVDSLLREGGEIEKSDYILSSDGKVQNYNGYRAVNVSMRPLDEDGSQAADFLVSPEKPHMVLYVSSTSGLQVKLDSVRN